MKDNELTIDHVPMPPQADVLEAVYEVYKNSDVDATHKPTEVLSDYQKHKQQVNCLADHQWAEHLARYRARELWTKLPTLQEAQEVERPVDTAELLSLGQTVEQLRHQAIQSRMEQQTQALRQVRFPKLHRTWKPRALRDHLIAQESAQVGVQLFDPETNTKEFYCLDAHTLVWIRETGDAGQTWQQLVRYEIKPEGIIKHVDDSYKPVHEAEAQNLSCAMQYYVEGLRKTVYPQPVEYRMAA